jgi:hypothetical protein
MKFVAVVAALFAGAAAAFDPAPVSTRSMTTNSMTAAGEVYVDEERRFTMNLILLGSAAVTVGGPQSHVSFSSIRRVLVAVEEELLRRTLLVKTYCLGLPCIQASFGPFPCIGIEGDDVT